ncbi:MAG: hypothetical protein KME60_08380 [Cyanomargarita calcarea GSE-NOS-MK-12-04C]|uniref:Uncharacterized protein n=1 Tax=Cyanomargarita calcarea GSE-NOS-MK-12-04C TaxID=2839659 RepID=A0A951QM11_9CYAN|nr:hypothetical protein [Cyanomargarita calcarea GSE-NOS-MK-12-04C]
MAIRTLHFWLHGLRNLQHPNRETSGDRVAGSALHFLGNFTINRQNHTYSRKVRSAPGGIE